MFTSRVANSLANYYVENGGWDGVGLSLRVMRRSSSDRFVLTDPSGRVVADTAEQLGVGELAGQSTLGEPLSIDANGTTVS